MLQNINFTTLGMYFFTFMKRGQASLKDIAKALNISISTVSRALRGMGEVKPETRKAVLELADEWKYKPNPLALALLKDKTNTIGVILPEIESYYFASILKGINELALERGYRIITCYSNESVEGEKRAIDDLLFSRVDGIIACPANDLVDFSHYDYLQRELVPFVHIDRDCPGLQAHKVLTNNFNATKSVVNYLYSTGCKRIALIANLDLLAVGRQRYEGYIDALKDNNLPFDRDLIIHGNLGTSTSEEATKYLLALSPLPDSIICNNDSVAMAVMKMIKERGYSIPDDISIVGFSDDPFSSFLEPSLTTVAQPAYLIGMKALEVMLDILDEKIPIIIENRIVVDSALKVRKSTRPILKEVNNL